MLIAGICVAQLSPTCPSRWSTVLSVISGEGVVEKNGAGTSPDGTSAVDPPSADLTAAVACRRHVVRIEWDSGEGHLAGFRQSPEFRGFFEAVRPFVKRHRPDAPLPGHALENAVTTVAGAQTERRSR